MGLRDRWNAHRERQLRESVSDPGPGIWLFAKADYKQPQVQEFIHMCEEVGLEVDGLTYESEYRVYARKPGTMEIKLPGEPGFLPLGDFSGAAPETQAVLPADYYERDWNADISARREGGLP